MPDTHATPDYDLTDEPEEILTPQEAATSRFIERMLELHEQGRQAMNELLNESEPTSRYRLYRKLLQINDAVGLPTDSMAVLRVQAPAQESGTA